MKLNYKYLIVLLLVAFAAFWFRRSGTKTETVVAPKAEQQQTVQATEPTEVQAERNTDVPQKVIQARHIDEESKRIFVPKNIFRQLLKVADIFPALENFFEEDDNIFIETGMISPACGAMRLPKGALYSAQTLWGSIGWATPAAFGGAIAERERRTILFTGEGAHQFTIQEVANFFEHNLRPIIFVLNNSGYTIERMLSNDAMDRFNEIILNVSIYLEL